MLNRQLPGMEPAIERVKGLLIATHIGEAALELRRDREAKVLACKADDEKGIPDLLGYKLIYLLRLGRIATQKYPPPPSGKIYQGTQ